MKIFLPSSLTEFVESRVRGGLYKSASDVVAAGLGALAREEKRGSVRDFKKIMAMLPQDPITPEIEQQIERCIRRSRSRAK